MKQRAGIANKPNHLKLGQTPHLYRALSQTRGPSTMPPPSIKESGRKSSVKKMLRFGSFELSVQTFLNLSVSQICLKSSACSDRQYTAITCKPEHPKPAYLKQIPTDIFTNEPLLYQHIDEGYQLYSVGPNRKDDTGRTLLWPDPGDDLTIRMLLASTD